MVHVLNVNDETQNKIPDKLSELSVPETGFDRPTQTHHKNHKLQFQKAQFYKSSSLVKSRSPTLVLSITSNSMSNADSMVELFPILSTSPLYCNCYVCKGYNSPISNIFCFWLSIQFKKLQTMSLLQGFSF